MCRQMLNEMRLERERDRLPSEIFHGKYCEKTVRKVYRKMPCSRVAKNYSPQSLPLVQIKPGKKLRVDLFTHLFYKRRTDKTQV